MTHLLTPQKAAELLKELQYAKAEMGQLSIRDEYFKQALEQLKESRGGNGWIEWKGGECPVAEAVKVDVRFRNGDIDEGLSAGGWVWLYSPQSNYQRDIVAYRVISEAPL